MSDVTDLKAENAKLRKENDTLCHRIDELCAENERLRQENQSIGVAAYDFGYRNGSVHYELEHCPACKNVADLQEALEENAKLREELEQWHRLTAGIELPEYPITEFKPKDLERENAKLRKENDTLCHRIDELCAENERLRQENQSIGVAAYELGRKSMADENAKLREER